MLAVGEQTLKLERSQVVIKPYGLVEVHAEHGQGGQGAQAVESGDGVLRLGAGHRKIGFVLYGNAARPSGRRHSCTWMVTDVTGVVIAGDAQLFGLGRIPWQEKIRYRYHEAFVYFHTAALSVLRLPVG